MNLLKKQINVPSGWKEFFRPSRSKLIVPLIFLLIFPLLLLLLFVPFINIVVIIIIAAFRLPISPILKALEALGLLTITRPPAPVPWVDPLELFFIGFFWAVIFYFISCLVVYLKKRLPKLIFSKDLLKSTRSAVNKHPKITILIIVALAIAGACYFYKIPQRIFTAQPAEPTPPSEVIQPSELETIPSETVSPEITPSEKITPSPEAALPLPPTNLSCDPGDEQVVLNWNNPDIPNFSHTRIYRSGDVMKQPGELVYDNITTESLVDKGLTNSLFYYYTLRAVDTLGRESVEVPNYTFNCIGRPSLEISKYNIYQNEKYGYDMISSEATPILKVIVFDDHNGNGRKDIDEKGLGAVHLDQYWNDEFFGGSMTPENGVVNFFEIPLYQKITVSLPSRDNKYWGWRTVFEEGWLVTTNDKHEFILSETPEETKIIYFGLQVTKYFAEGMCEKTNFKMAFILLVQNLDEATDERLNTLNRIKEEFSYYFPQATRNLTGMDTNDDIYIMKTEENMCHPNCGEETTWFSLDRIAKKFYETHDDIYDFISIYRTFKAPKTKVFHTISIQNIKGIGESIFDNSEQYGSERVLRGINFMGDIGNYIMSYETSMEFGPTNILLHETGHQWCCYVGDNFARGQNNAKLEIIQQNIHFYIGLQSPYETQTAMNAHKWVSNNGAFQQNPEEKPGLRKYHPFQLYFMGLLPKEEYDTKFQIYDAGYNGNWNFENTVPYKQVGVRDIIEVAGERICVP